MLVLLPLLLVSCNTLEKTVQDSSSDTVSGSLEIVEPLAVDDVNEQNNTALIVNSTQLVSACQSDDECAQGEYCIDDHCGKLTDLYIQDCEVKCNFASAEITTSDGQVFTVKQGLGSYTLAGALEWKLLRISDYCKSADFVIPIKLLFKDKGKIINEVVTLTRIGEQSKVLKHPTIPSSAFTLTVSSIAEECS